MPSRSCINFHFCFFRYRHGLELELDAEAALGLYIAASQRALHDQQSTNADGHHTTEHIRLDDVRLLEGYGDIDSDELEYILYFRSVDHISFTD